MATVSVDLPSCTQSTGSGFTHPGIYHDCNSLDRIQKQYSEGLEPFKTSFDMVVDRSDTPYLTSETWTSEGPFETVIFAGKDGHNIPLQDDGKAVYISTLGWYATGNSTWLSRALTTIRGWSSTLTYMNDHIQGAEGLGYMTAAAEILRATSDFSGWGQNDTDQYNSMIDSVIANTPWNATNGPTRSNLFFNQGVYGNSGVMAVAVFAENAELYNQMVKQTTECVSNNPNVDPGLPCQFLGPETGYNGQVKEMGRDQGHPLGSLRGLSYMGRTALLQKDFQDAPNYFTLAENRLAAAHEYHGQYNRLNFDYIPPYQETNATQVQETKVTIWTELNSTARYQNYTEGRSPVEAIGAGFYAFLKQGFKASDFGNYTIELQEQGEYGWDVFEFGDPDSYKELFNFTE
ncbi:unnamed protein product [Clonostachys rosea]|uniref:Alginate lyase domain-containing protein n=1 Tax=Bionectria ochroleuca TaxID=29856 RepID=A0ABY6UVC5_BIOOC|nr:unnamed protein product [Clonostachys rosea]